MFRLFLLTLFFTPLLVHAHSEHAHLSSHHQEPNHDRQKIQKIEKLMQQARATSEQAKYQQAGELIAATNPKLPRLKIYQAEIEQYFHRFDSALRILNSLPGSASATLLKANILLTQGRAREAAQSCKQLYGQVDSMLYFTCITRANSLEGKLDKSYRLLRTLLERNQDNQSDTMHWALVTLAEMAERKNDLAAAESFYTQALQIKSHDIASRIAYADILLNKQRFNEVVVLTENFLNHDPLLLRYVRALNIQGDLRTSAHFCELKRRILNYKTDQQHLHHDTLAEYHLYFQHDAEEAIKWANNHWQQQKTPRDTRLFAKIAINLIDESVLKKIQQWSKQHQTEDAMLDAMFENSAI